MVILIHSCIKYHNLQDNARLTALPSLPAAIQILWYNTQYDENYSLPQWWCKLQLQLAINNMSQWYTNYSYSLHLVLTTSLVAPPLCPYWMSKVCAWRCDANISIYRKYHLKDTFRLSIGRNAVKTYLLKRHTGINYNVIYKYMHQIYFDETLYRMLH